jgi:hypothetical protein
VISKRLGSRYYPGRRSSEWLKHPLVQTQEVIICGWRFCEVLQPTHDEGRRRRWMLRERV